MRPHLSCGKLCACHCVHHPPCPHRRSCGQRRPHPQTAFAVQVETPHFSRPPSARYRRFCRCSDSVSDTRTKQAVVPPNASQSRGAGGTGPGAARGGPGEVRRDAHPSIPISPRRSTVAPSMQLALSASSAVRPAASLSSNATGFDQDDAAGLAAERAFDYHCSRSAYCLKLMHKCTLQMQPCARPVYACA